MYGFLCFKSVEELFGKKEEMLKMIKRLEELGATEASQKTLEIYKAILEFESYIQEKKTNLYDVWRAVETVDRIVNKNSKDELIIEKAIKKWNRKNIPRSPDYEVK